MSDIIKARNYAGVLYPKRLSVNPKHFSSSTASRTTSFISSPTWTIFFILETLLPANTTASSIFPMDPVEQGLGYAIW